MKKLFLAALICIGTISASAQSIDERVGNYMNQGNWFDMQRAFAVNKDSIHPFLQDFGQALLDNFFNRPEAACRSVNKLLTERQDEMGFDNTCSMLSILASNLGKLGENAQAAEVLKDFCDQLEGKVDSALLTGYRRVEKEYRALSGYELYQWDRPEADLALPFRIDSIGAKGSTTITLEGSLNGKEQLFTLDTGAGVNVVTPEVAKACGMKMLDVETAAHGIRLGGGHLALAEEIKLGDFIMKNVPFYVLDMMTGDEKADRYLKQLKVIIGLPVLNQLQEVKLDFRANRLTIPKVLTPAPKFAPNICYNNGSLLDIEVLYTNELLKMNFDSGAGVSQLNYSYYERHKDRITPIAKADSMGMAGFGGTTRVGIYKLGKACFGIGEYAGCVDSLSVISTPAQSGIHFAGDGTVGMDIFRSFSTVTINLKDMFVQTTPRMQGSKPLTYDSKRLHLNLPNEELTVKDALLNIAGLYLDWKASLR